MGAQEEFDTWLPRMESIADVLGIILSGSHAIGLPTQHSDFDLLLVAADGAERGLEPEKRRDRELDVSVMPIRKFENDALPGSGSEFYRYSYTHARVLKDATGGRIHELLERKRTLSAAEAEKLMPDLLDGFLNCTYRALKDERDGYDMAARLDAADAIPGYLSYVFALHRRVRPYNKYLAWELEQHPLGERAWEKAHLLDLFDGVVSPDPGRALHILVNELEPYARAAGHGEVLDSWGEDLELMRGRAS